MWTRFKRWFHRMGAPVHFFKEMRAWEFYLGWMSFILLTAGLGWGLFFAPPDYQQGDSFRIIYIHVPAASIAMSLYAGMAIASAIFLIWRMKMADLVAQVCAPIGATFTFLALITGAIWGKPTWGTWWVWDARLTSMLILLFLYFGVIAMRSAMIEGFRASRAVSLLAIVGIINLPVIKYSVEWWNTLHQPATFKLTEKPAMPAEMWLPLLLSLLGHYFWVGWAVIKSARLKILSREGDSKWLKEWLATQSR